jgi:hypoxanthine-guanine phosphoribosyltransferase
MQPMLVSDVTITGKRRNEEIEELMRKIENMLQKKYLCFVCLFPGASLHCFVQKAGVELH